MAILRQGSALPAAALIGLSLTGPAFAGPSDYVFSPIVVQGEREIDFKAGVARARDGGRTAKASLGFGYGVTERWFSEFYAIWHKEPGAPRSFDAWEWENKFQLTETGQYPVDIGLLLEIERPQERSEGYEVKWGPLLQTDFSNQVQGNLNLLLTRHLRAESGATPQLSYQWQLKYRWRPAFEYGVQGFGELGTWDHWLPASAQVHQFGPAVFGKVHLVGRQAIEFNAAWLFGRGPAAPSHTLRLQAEYEF